MRQSSQKLAGLLLGLLISCTVSAADNVELNPTHPTRYTVVRGDTLWDIAGRFLREPWLWPEVWHVNPQIKNPHLIYPGDVISLTYADGRPLLSLSRGSHNVRLSPSVRSTPLDGAIPSIPIDAIHQFLSRPYVVGKQDLDAAPYIVAHGNEHLIGGAGNRIYVRGIGMDAPPGQRFDILRLGDAYKDAESGEVLGYEGLYIGDARLETAGDPATLELVSTAQETLKGDRLIPVAKDTPLTTFFPSAPDRPVHGSIIAVLGGVTQIGQYQVVVLDRGEQDGLEKGTVLAIDERGETIKDAITPNPWDKIKLPDELAGHLMVFRTFPRVSFALVMDATRAIHVRDHVRNP
jgi:hypothetical protein